MRAAHRWYRTSLRGPAAAAALPAVAPPPDTLTTVASRAARNFSDTAPESLALADDKRDALEALDSGAVASQGDRGCSVLIAGQHSTGLVRSPLRNMAVSRTTTKKGKRQA